LDNDTIDIVERAFEDAAPYLSNSSYLRKRIGEIVSKVRKIDELLKAIEEACFEEKETQIRTDFRIFLNALRRELQKMGAAYGSKI